jgi:catalase-peroxidase
VDYRIINANDIQALKSAVLDTIRSSKLSISDLVKAAWASASTYRCTDHRGGANGGRVRLLPQKNWKVNDPISLDRVIAVLEEIQKRFNDHQQQSNIKTQVSFADLVILAGNTAIEEAACRAGYSNVRVPFVAGRTDALQCETDIDSFQVLQPIMDGFRNYEGNDARPEISLVDRAHLLSLKTPEMVVLLGGLRVLNANSETSLVGVLTDQPETLSNDFFTNLLDENTIWSSAGDGKLFRGDRLMGRPWMASRVDLVMGSNSQLRAICEAYACCDSNLQFVNDFVSAWVKVTMLDRFDLVRTANDDNSTTESFFLWSSKRRMCKL